MPAAFCSWWRSRPLAGSAVTLLDLYLDVARWCRRFVGIIDAEHEPDLSVDTETMAVFRDMDVIVPHVSDPDIKKEGRDIAHVYIDSQGKESVKSDHVNFFFNSNSIDVKGEKIAYSH